MYDRPIWAKCALGFGLIALVILSAALVAGCGGQETEKEEGELIIGQPVAGKGDTYTGPEAELVSVPPDPQLADTAGGGDAYQSFDYSADMALLVNRARCNAGLSPVTVNSKLNEAATAHAMSMAEDGAIGPPDDGGTFLRSFGHTTQGWGMNFCGGYKEIRGFYDGWGGDTNPIVTNPQYQELGFGYVVSAPHGDMAFVTLFLAGTSTQPELPTPSCSDLDFSSLDEPVVTEEPPDDDPGYISIQFGEVGTLSPGDSKDGSITWPDEGHIWTLTGTAGQAVTIEVVSTSNGDFIVELHAPDGSFVDGADTFFGGGTATISPSLPMDGTYDILVYAWFPGDYTITVR